MHNIYIPFWDPVTVPNCATAKLDLFRTTWPTLTKSAQTLIQFLRICVCESNTRYEFTEKFELVQVAAKVVFVCVSKKCEPTTAQTQ